PGLLERALGSLRTSLDIQDRIDEYTMFQSALIRRHAQVFQGATNKFADTFAAFVGILAVISLVPGAMVLAAWMEQVWPGRVAAVFGASIADWVARVPALSARVSVLLVVADVYACVALQRLKRRLRQTDVRAHERVAAF